MANVAGLKEKIFEDLKTAQRNREAEKVSALRMILAAVHNQEIEKKRAATDEDVVSVLSAQRKKHLDSIAQFRQGERLDLVAREEAELAITKSYLPAELSSEELRAIVKEAITETGAATAADFGKVMKMVMARARGRADGTALANLVKEALHANG